MKSSPIDQRQSATMADEIIELPTRVNRLFSTFHSRTEPEQDSADVARSVSAIVGKTILAEEIIALRTGSIRVGVDPTVLQAIAQHFHVLPVYLTGTSDEARPVDRQLRLLSAARDAGVRHMALRGNDIDITALTRELSRLAPPDHSAA